jgi:hypothetical protein
MKKTGRRKFLTTMAIAGVTTTVAAKPFKKEAKQKQLVHHVFFWLKNPGSLPDRDKLVEGVRTLANIETVREIHVGVLADTEKRSVVDATWHVSELIFFDDLAGQSTYQTHPVHLAFVQNYSHLWEKVIVYDAMEV